MHNPLRVVIPGNNVYIAERGLNTELNASVLDGAIVRVRKDGSAFTRIVPNLLQPESLAVLGKRVYWTDASKNGTLRSATLDGSGSQAYSSLGKSSYTAPLAANSTVLFTGDLRNLTRATPYIGTNMGLTPLLRTSPQTLVADETPVY